MTLATSDDTNRCRSRVGHLDVKSLGKLSSGISHELDHRATNSLVISPSSHDGGIVYTPNDNLVDSSLLESVLILKVGRNLLRRSGGGKSTGQTNHKKVFALGVIGERDHVGGELLVEINSGDSITDSNIKSS